MTEPVKRWLALTIPPAQISLQSLIKQISKATYQYQRPAMKDLASPALLEALNDAIKEDPKLASLVNQWANRSRRIAMQEWAIRFIIDHVRFQLRTENTINIALYGSRGTGKTEAALTLALLILSICFNSDMPNSILGMTRSPSIANWLLGRATDQKKTMVLVEDESEREFSQGSQKNLTSLIQNMDTMRILRHSLIVCMISLEFFGSLVSRCDFVLRTIFSDRTNKVNWCILYTVNLAAKELVPKAIVGLPIHELGALRVLYKDWKYESQVGLTGSGGAHAASRAIVKEKAYQLAQFAKDHGLQEASPRRLEEVLRDEIPNGGDMVLEDQADTALWALRIMNEEKEKAPNPEDEMRFEWTSDFSWAEEIASLIFKHHQFKKYYSVFYATEILGLNPYKDQKRFEEVTGQKLTANKTRIRKMNRDNEFQGWLKHVRSILHEKFVAQKLRQAKWTVKEKPKFTYGGIDYEEDLCAEKGKIKIWLNCKCGSGNRTYTSQEYLTTWILANKVNVEAYVLYLDLETNIHDIWFPADHFSVGSNPSPLSNASSATKGAPSTPFLVLRALSPQEATKLRSASNRDGNKRSVPARPRQPRRRQNKPKSKPKGKPIKKQSKK